mmetsp:Transcript_81868/g.163489  ORF Transcript_81868/g.163489 Transcript_81868/m.163489 type:complete len:500 (+) Transcript_81868:83-1582(+)
MSISLFFILSPRGDTIISKDFRGDTPPGATEAFFRKVKSWDKGDAPPVFLLDGVNYLYIRKNGLLIACTTRFNMSPSVVIELLNRTAKVFKDYCGVLSEESIRMNFILIYELLDEILDYGYPQGTSTETLKNFIYNEPKEVEAVANPVLGSLGQTVSSGGMGKVTTQSSSATRKPIVVASRNGAGMSASLKGGGKKQKNEIFVDILEQLTVLFSSQGHVLNSSIDGCIQMKSYLAGNPELRLALNEDLVIGASAGGKNSYGGPGVVLDDCNFHECVNLSEFESTRTLSFYPPDGEFVALNYRVTGEFQIPFRVFPVVEECAGSGGLKLDVTVRVRADIPEAHYGANVVVRIPLPRATLGVTTDLGGGGGGLSAGPKPAIGQTAEYVDQASADGGSGGAGSGGGDAGEGGGGGSKSVVWTIKKFPGSTEQSLRIRVTLSSPAQPATRKEVGAVSLAFEVPMYNVSNLQVKYLRIAEQGKAYNPYRWVRYVTQSSSYVQRV